MAFSHFLFMNNIDKPWWKDGLIVFAKVSGYIIGPIILAIIVGKYFDTKYDTNNKFFLIAITIAFILTIFLIWKETKVYKKKLDKEENNK